MAANPNLLDELARAISQQIGGPQPQAPVYQPAQFSNQQGFAIARNPQLGGMIANQVQAPGKALYESQVNAFTEAMQNRRNAMSVGGAMVNAQTRAAGVQRALRLVPTTVVINGVNQRVVDAYDPMTGEHVGREMQGEAAYSPTVGPGVNPDTGQPTMYTYPKSAGGTAFPQVGPGGQPIGIPPPAGITNDYNANAAFVQASGALKTAWAKLRDATKGQNVGEKMLGQTVGEMKFGGVFAPNYNAFEQTVKATLNAYIMSVTGLSFPESAYVRHRSELPLASDTDEQAAAKIENVLRRTLAEMGMQQGAYPGMGQQQGQVGPTADDILNRALERARGPR